MSGKVDVDVIPIPYQILDETGRIRKVNSTLLDTLGYARSDVEGSVFGTILVPESEAAFSDHLSTAREQNRFSKLDVTLQHSAGHQITATLVGQFEYDNAGNIEGVHCQFYEVDQSTATVENMMSQQSKIERLHDVVLELDQAIDETAVFRVVIEAAREILDFDTVLGAGVENERLVIRAATGDTDTDFPVEIGPIEDGTKLGPLAYSTKDSIIASDLDPDDIGTADQHYRSALTVPVGKYGIVQALDTKPDAFDALDEELMELLVSHCRNALGRIEQLEILKQRKASLRWERNRLEAIFEAVPEPVAHIRFEDGDPIVLAINSAFEETFGYTQDEIAGESINEKIVPPVYMKRAEKFDRIAESAAVTDEEVVREAIDGERTFRLRSSALDIGGEQEALAIYVDLSERKAKERELERENDRLEEFASIVSHDLRSPLTVARGRLELVEEECESKYLDEIVRTIDRMNAIIEDVLTLTRNGRTVTEAETESINLATLADQAWQDIGSSNGTVSIETNKTVVADRSRLRRVFQNLFKNATDHGGPSVTVTVGDCPNGFFVADDGSGIPESDQEKVFESGFTTNPDGTGLGLEIIEEIIKAHGWSIDLKWSEDGGARFDIDID